MALAGQFLRDVQKRVGELTEREDAIILDAATGAGETTCQIAQAMRGGRLITVDRDAASWDEWALPALRQAGLDHHVRFVCDDVCRLGKFADASVDLAVSDATLSAVGHGAADMIRQLRRVLKPGGLLCLHDLTTEAESEPDPGNIAVRSWRLMKAAAILAGQPYYDELPTSWVRGRLQDVGFEVLSLEIDPVRHPASASSTREWRRMTIGRDIPDMAMRRAIEQAWTDLVAQADQRGLTNKAGHYLCWARKR